MTDQEAARFAHEVADFLCITIPFTVEVREVEVCRCRSRAPARILISRCELLRSEHAAKHLIIHEVCHLAGGHRHDRAFCKAEDRAFHHYGYWVIRPKSYIIAQIDLQTNVVVDCKKWRDRDWPKEKRAMNKRRKTYPDFTEAPSITDQDAIASFS